MAVVEATGNRVVMVSKAAMVRDSLLGTQFTLKNCVNVLIRFFFSHTFQAVAVEEAIVIQTSDKGSPRLIFRKRNWSILRKTFTLNIPTFALVRSRTRTTGARPKALP